MIELRDAVVAFGSGEAGTRALDGVTARVGVGEWLSVTGGNGSGKTTLLSALAALVPLRSGDLRFEGGARPRTAILLQDPDNQLVASTVEMELRLSAAGVEDGDANVAVASAVDRFELGEFLSRNPHRLSGGEKQRLALATVWLERPELLLLDEPTAYLDADGARRCVEFVRELNANGTAVVWASPAGDVGSEHAGRAVRLEAGRVVAGGASELPREFEWHDLPPAPDGAREVLCLRGVSFAYEDGPPVFEGVDLTVRAGEFVGVSGGNGSGKTTLLLVAGGALDARSGSVARADDVERTGVRPVVYLPQSPERMFFAETVREELTFGPVHRGTPRRDAEARAETALAGVGLPPERFLDRDPMTLSGGEMRRVAFAVARVLEPGLLLLDEPTAGLDEDGLSVLATVLRGARGRGTAVVIASHDAALLERACDRVVSPGRQRASRTTRNPR